MTQSEPDCEHIFVLIYLDIRDPSIWIKRCRNCLTLIHSGKR